MLIGKRKGSEATSPFPNNGNGCGVQDSVYKRARTAETGPTNARTTDQGSGYNQGQINSSNPRNKHMSISSY